MDIGTLFKIVALLLWPFFFYFYIFCLIEKVLTSGWKIKTDGFK